MSRYALRQSEYDIQKTFLPLFTSLQIVGGFPYFCSNSNNSKSRNSVKSYWINKWHLISFVFILNACVWNYIDLIAVIIKSSVNDITVDISSKWTEAAMLT